MFIYASIDNIKPTEISIMEDNSYSEVFTILDLYYNLITELLSSHFISLLISALHEAASQGVVRTVSELLNKQEVDINCKDINGVSMTTPMTVDEYHWLSFN